MSTAERGVADVARNIVAPMNVEFHNDAGCDEDKDVDNNKDGNGREEEIDPKGDKEE